MTIGELPAWLVGWFTFLRVFLCGAIVARGLEQYLNGLIKKFGADVPEWMEGVEVFGVENCSIVAVLIIFLETIIYTRGMQASKIYNNVLTGMKLTTLVIMVFAAFLKFDKSNFTPFTIEEEGGL